MTMNGISGSASAVAIGLVAGDAAVAGGVPFTYTTTASPTTLTAPTQGSTGNSAILTETPIVSGSGMATPTLSPIPVATYTVPSQRRRAIRQFPLLRQDDHPGRHDHGYRHPVNPAHSC